MSNVRVRYAPSPTGDLHIGNARTALFNYLFAKSQGGKMILRIEDTDTARNVAHGATSQMNYLRWLGIEWDEGVDIGGDYGPYDQLSRLDVYQKYADQLLEQGLAYKCYCTSEELEAERETLANADADQLHYSQRCLHHPPTDRETYSIRFKVPNDITYTFNDIVRGEITFESADIGDWVIMKANGIPTYNFACAIDDHLMEISHIFRGEEHITNTPRQMMVYDAFGWQPPTFGHLTLIVNEAGKKLSKRDADTLQFVEQYARLGYLPEGLFNFIALLGHSPKAETEVLTMEALIDSFDVTRLSKSPSTFDRAKLAFINTQHMKSLDNDDLLELCMPHLIDADLLAGHDDRWASDFVALLAERLTHGAQIVSLYDEFFASQFDLEEEATSFLTASSLINRRTLEIFKEKLSASTAFTPEVIKGIIKETGTEADVKGKQLFMPCRIGVSGQMHGPDLPMMVTLLGRDLVLERLDQVIGGLE